MTALHFTLFLQMPFVGIFYGSVNYPCPEVISLFLEKQSYKCKYSEAVNFFSKLKLSSYYMNQCIYLKYASFQFLLTF